MSSVVQFSGLSIAETVDCGLLWTVAEKIFIQGSKLVLMAFKKLCKQVFTRRVRFFARTKSCCLAACCEPSSVRPQRCFLLNKSKEEMCAKHIR